MFWLEYFSLFGIDRYTVLFLKWKTNKDLLYSAGNSAHCYVVAWVGGEFGEEWIHVFVWLNPCICILYPCMCIFCPSETITTLLICYTPIYSKTFFKNVFKRMLFLDPHLSVLDFCHSP